MPDADGPLVLPRNEFELVRFLDDLRRQVEQAGTGDGVDWRARAEAAEARLAEVRQVAVGFRNHHAGVLGPAAEALYHAVLQVIDREDGHAR